MNPAAVAVQGIGFGPRSVASQGFISGVLYAVNADFDCTCAVALSTAAVLQQNAEFLPGPLVEAETSFQPGGLGGVTTRQHSRSFFKYFTRRH